MQKFRRNKGRDGRRLAKRLIKSDLGRQLPTEPQAFLAIGSSPVSAICQECTTLQQTDHGQLAPYRHASHIPGGALAKTKIN